MKNHEPGFLQKRIIPHLYKDVSLGIKKGEEDNVTKMVEDTAQEEGYELKKIYGELLCCAACHGDIKTAEFCKNKGGDLDYEDPLGRPPLWLAKNFKKNQMAKALKEWGAHKETFERWDSISISPENSEFNKMSEALEHIARECTDEELDNPSHSSENPVVSCQKHEITYTEIQGFYYYEFSPGIEQDVKKEYIERNVEKFVQDNKCELKEIYGELLYLAACHNNIEAAKFCKDKGADLDYEGRGGATPLWVARHNKNNQMVKALEKWGARKDSHKHLGPSSGLESPRCNNQEKQMGRTKKRSCNLI
jgi:hypothetical protein